MTVRVNLLQAGELRYQGAVGREFILRAILGSALAIVAIFLLLSSVHRSSLRHELALSRESWKENEPRFTRARLMQQQLASLTAVQGELKGWNASRIEWNVLLSDLQRVVPSTVQLTKLYVRGELGVLETPVAEGDPLKTPARKFTVRLDGKTSGDTADEIVVGFARGLREAPSFQQALESVKLQGLQRNATGGKESERMFGIEGVSALRVMP